MTIRPEIQTTDTAHSSGTSHRFVLSAMLVGALLFASCGGSDSSSDSDAEGPSASEVQDLVESGDAGDIAEAAGVSEACVELSLAISAATAGMAPGTGPVLDIESLNKSFDAIKGEAPENLRADIEIVKKGMAEYLSLLADYGNDFTVVMTAPEAIERFANVFDEEFSAASERFGKWMESVCSQ